MGVEAVTYGRLRRDLDGDASTHDSIWDNGSLADTRRRGRAAARHSGIDVGRRLRRICETFRRESPPHLHCGQPLDDDHGYMTDRT